MGETIRIAPSGTSKISGILNATAVDLVEAGEKEIFTPSYFFCAKKPLNAYEEKRHIYDKGKSNQTQELTNQLDTSHKVLLETHSKTDFQLSLDLLMIKNKDNNNNNSKIYFKMTKG